jgi:hypothetical protein
MTISACGRARRTRQPDANSVRSSRVDVGKGDAAMSKLPPVPPQNRSPKGPGADPAIAPEDRNPDAPENLDEQGRQGNIKQNTHNQGYQQDR